MTAAAQKQIVARALELPRAARVRLLRKLEDSLVPKEEKLPRKEWDAAWAIELEKRVAEMESGKVKGVPLSEARKRWKKILRGP